MKRPNILYIITDQLRYDALSCNGSICQTPAIDYISSRSTNFSRGYTPISLCSPARASIMTGLYPHHHGQLANQGNFNSVFDNNLKDKPLMTQVMHNNGYKVGYVGKFHMPFYGGEEHWGIDEWGRGVLDRAKKQIPDYELGKTEVQRLEWGADAPFCGKGSLKAEDTQEYMTTDISIDILEKFKKQDDPFILFASYYGPHFPYAVPEPYDTMYKPEEVTMPENFYEMFVNKPSVQQYELKRWNSSHLTIEGWKNVVAHYYGFVSFIDAQIKRLLDKMDEMGILEDTMIIFAPDHGDMCGSHRIFNKGMNMYEETHHIPFMISLPGQKEKKECDEFVSLIDMMPTVLEAGQVKDAPKMDGRSLMPLLNGEKVEDWRKEIFCEWHGYEPALCTIRMIRDKNWKYIYNPTSEDELYDEVSDPGELYNLAPLVGFNHVLRRMREKMYHWLYAVDDNIVEECSWQSNSYGLHISDRER